MRKVVASISILVAVVFSAIALLTYPLWLDISVFLGTALPLMAILSALGVGYGVYAGFQFRKKYHWIHFIIMGLVDLVMVALLVVLFKELGTDSAIIKRGAAAWLPIAAAVLALSALIWFAPRWKFLQNNFLRAALIAALAVIALLWVNLPFRLRMVVQPVVFLQQDGMQVVWDINRIGTASLTYGISPEMDQVSVSQSGGLLDLGDHIQSIYLPTVPVTGELYFQASSEGIRSLQLTNVVSAGKVESDPVRVSFPEPGKELSIVAFSDIHEQTRSYDRLARSISWTGVDEAVYIGDLVSYAADPQQLAHAILELPTGGETLPRVFVRGNHETRGEAARWMADWLVPPQGNWYFTFSSGNVFFVVIDSGEDKADSDPSYAGMIDYADYQQQQATWLANVFNSPEYRQADYRVVLVHIPPFIEKDQDRFGTLSPEFAPVIDLLNNQGDIDLMMSGHIHEGAIWSPEETGLPYPVTTCGGQYADDMAAVTASFGAQGIELKVVDIDGNTIDQAVFPIK